MGLPCVFLNCFDGACTLPLNPGCRSISCWSATASHRDATPPISRPDPDDPKLNFCRRSAQPLTGSFCSPRRPPPPGSKCSRAPTPSRLADPDSGPAVGEPHRPGRPQRGAAADAGVRGADRRRAGDRQWVVGARGKARKVILNRARPCKSLFRKSHKITYDLLGQEMMYAVFIYYTWFV